MPDYVLIKEIMKPDTEGGYVALHDGDKAETYYEIAKVQESLLPKFKIGEIVTVTRTGNPYEFEEGKYFIVHRDDINGYFE